jgi:hypothetical protein
MGCCYGKYNEKDLVGEPPEDEPYDLNKDSIGANIYCSRCGCVDIYYNNFIIPDEDQIYIKKYYYNLHYSLENTKENKNSILFYNLHYTDVNYELNNK